MKTENRILMQMARESLKGKWGVAIGTFVIYMLISAGLQMTGIVGMRAVGSIASLILSGPLILGVSIFSLAISRNQDPKMEQLFLGFTNFGTALGTYAEFKSQMQLLD